MDPKKVECLDCWGEALMTVGLYSFTYRIPKNLLQRAKQAYDDSFYQMHQKSNYPVVI